jgi:hypothetical protein
MVHDEVNHPAHYTAGNIETIDYIVDVLGLDGAIDYCHGNILKYLGSRLHTKYESPVTDMKKAYWYLGKMIELQEEVETFAA